MTPLPRWVTNIRPTQTRAVEEIVEAFSLGAKVVFFDGPTGTGKTLIGELVRRELDEKGIYLCSSLTLQDQTIRDFPYGKVIKGRSNYPTAYPPTMANECRGRKCGLCKNHFPDPDDPEDEYIERCKYRLAKAEAAWADLAILNTTYLLYEANGKSPVFSENPFIIADECDMLESELMRYVELRIPASIFRLLDIAPPKDRIHYTSIVKYLLGPTLHALKKTLEAVDPDSEQARELRRLQMKIKYTARHINDGNWIRDTERGGLVMKPVSVAPFAQTALWSHSGKWLCMSATVINPAQMAADLGLRDHEWEFVSAPMSFPVENRPIHLALVADMKRSNINEGARDAAYAIQSICEAHEGERVLIHAVSYDLTRLLASHINTKRTVLYYTSARERAKVLAQFRSTPNAMLIAPSLDRGVDLAGDECRVIVIAKVPFPNLGDKQVSSKLHAERGQEWYATETIRTIVQMTGRGVRSDTDHATTYILDSQFRRVWQQHKQSFPKWWRDAVNPAFRYSDLTPAIVAHYRAEGDQHDR